jgi:hypothetical protein
MRLLSKQAAASAGCTPAVSGAAQLAAKISAAQEKRQKDE